MIYRFGNAATPDITDFSDSQHDHEDAPGGGTIALAAVSDAGDAAGKDVGTGAGDVAAGDKGVTNGDSHDHAGGDGAAIAAGAMTASATDVLFGRETAGAGTAEEIACTAAGRALLDDADAAAQRLTLGLGDAATKGVTGSDANAVTGTAGSTGEGVAWNADGDVVASGAVGRNILINSNGANPINQKQVADGDALATSNGYMLDAWEVAHNCTSVQFENSSGGSGMRCVTAGGGSIWQAFQDVEFPASYGGETVTLHAKVKASAAGVVKMVVYDGTTFTNGDLNTGTDWEVIEVTATLQATPTSVRAYLNASPGIADGAWFEFEWIKLEFGSQRTTWQVPDYGQELARCQRRFLRIESSANAVILCSGYAYSTSAWAGTLYLPTPMRSNPALTVSAADDFALYGAGNNEAATAVTLVSNNHVVDGDGNVIGLRVNVAVTGTPLTQYDNMMLVMTDGTNGYLELSADL